MVTPYAIDIDSMKIPPPIGHFGSERESDRAPFLRGRPNPLNREELDVGHHHPLGLQEQIAQVPVARPRLISRRRLLFTASTTPKRTFVRQ